MNRLIADSLHQDPISTLELTELIMTKTQGNPFFVNQILEKLVEEKNIYFNHQELCWKWDVVKIQNLDITDNVVDLLISKIKSLSVETQEVLKIASCIGNQFELDALAIEKKSSDIASALWHAVEEGLLNPVGQRSRHYDDKMWGDLGIQTQEGSVTVFQFQHDKIQQASYALMPEEDKKKTHLQIGRQLVNKLSDRLGEQVFDVVQHFNNAQPLLENKQEKLEIAELNLIAGNKAKSSNSYQLALAFYTAGMTLIDAVENEQLYQEFLLGRSETEYLSGHYEESEHLFDKALEKANNNFAKADIYSSKMKLYENTSRYPKAISAAILGLKLLGVRLPEKPGQLRILTELLLVKSRLFRKSIDDLKYHKALDSRNLQLVMRILNNLWGPAYLNNQNLLALAILKMVNISLRHGNSAESSTAYAFYGFVCCAQLNQLNQGYEYAKLGMWLNEKYKDEQLTPKVSVIFAGCVMPWHDHFESSIAILYNANKKGQEVHDL
ncbi:MAG: hypothetical protein KAR20_07720, partial [Candidatus Heimdallarchaeota archaeon]|nr:hypothetical protein [Candidatus Heimdallarchaeota archaeon]